ncbi:MAG: hypothetical protein LBE75_06065 [Burkholderiales bacterium]|jgi:hypothetical protein|nr:hypothetical protein [Burkholderiales bacterium]
MSKTKMPAQGGRYIRTKEGELKRVDSAPLPPLATAARVKSAPTATTTDAPAGDATPGAAKKGN